MSETSKTIMEIIAKQLENGDVKGMKEYGVSIDAAEDENYNWKVEAMQEMADALKYQQKEIKFLKQRNKELRQKSWFQVYEENLKLIKEKEKMVNDLVKYEKTIEQLRKELIQVGNVADNYFKSAIQLNEENTHLKDVLTSVETFIQQYSK